MSFRPCPPSPNAFTRTRAWEKSRKLDVSGTFVFSPVDNDGHSHRYEEQRLGNTVLLNPGSCGPRRFNQAITMAFVSVENGQITVHRIDIPNTRPPAKIRAADLKTQIETAMREKEVNCHVPCHTYRA